MGQEHHSTLTTTMNWYMCIEASTAIFRPKYVSNFCSFMHSAAWGCKESQEKGRSCRITTLEVGKAPQSIRARQASEQVHVCTCMRACMWCAAAAGGDPK